MQHHSRPLQGAPQARLSIVRSGRQAKPGTKYLRAVKKLRKVSNKNKNKDFCIMFHPFFGKNSVQND